jgi:hypothetical protein
MSTIDTELTHLRADLAGAVRADLRRSARRRRLARLSLVPALVLASAGVAAAVVGGLGGPAPDRVTHSLQRLDHLLPPSVRDAPHRESPDLQRLRVVAQADGHVVYAEQHDGIHCAVTASADGRPDGWQCLPTAKQPGPHEIGLITGGGGSTREQNFAAGRVGAPSARTVEIRVAGAPDPLVARVGLDGYFVAQLPDATMNASRAPSLAITALDRDGTVVARLPEDG